MSRKAKTEVLMVRLTPEDKAAIEKAATRAGMYASEYMRACTITMMLTDLDAHAVKTLLHGMGAAFTEFKAGLKGQRKLAF